MVEELFFGYNINSDRDADFSEAHLELKCTPLLKSRTDGSYRIKERLVCSMIDYFELVETRFEDSHLLAKCRLMLLLFYMHTPDVPIYDYEFLFRVLWQIPEKDLILIKKDYETIAEKVRNGEAHNLSEGDTIYLGACRKGQKGDTPQPQPYSSIKANKRAFSLKPAYIRYILKHVTESGDNNFSNYGSSSNAEYELVNTRELQGQSFEKIIIDRFKRFYGMNYVEICDRLGVEPYQSKSKYADIAGLIASNSKSKRISDAEEFAKSGIIMKTIRLRKNGMPKESMSFKNIDYQEIFDNDNWFDSEAYELFTNRFLFVVFRPKANEKITVHNNKTNRDITEQSYVLENVFFWTMSSESLCKAKSFWEHIRHNVLSDRINLDSFWSISDKRDFHVRPKAGKKIQLTPNPNGGLAEKYCYWFNADFVKRIIDENAQDI
ncbi:MAG: hypothetical protein K2K92_02265 [Duncaniella sp.]|nr:hypothetical protein [Duncaniella sp.]